MADSILQVNNNGYMNIPNGTRSITVLDSVTNSPIQNATVQIVDLTTNTPIGSAVSTNSYGTASFTFNNVQTPLSDNVVVNVSAPGYYTSQTTGGGDGSNIVKLSPLSVSNNGATSPVSSTVPQSMNNNKTYIIIGISILVLIVGSIFIFKKHK